MAIATLMILFPGLISYAVFLSLMGKESQSIDKMLVQIAFHSAFVLFIFLGGALLLSFNPYYEINITQPILETYQILKDDKVIPILLSEKIQIITISLFGTALFWGLLSAFATDRKWLNKLFSHWQLFNQSQIRTSWHDICEKSAYSYWVHFDLKSGKRIMGMIYSTSCELKDGGIAISNAHEMDDQNGAVFISSEMYVREVDIDGPIYFN